jgi:hypothetical protein
MGQPILHGFESDFHNGWMRIEIRVSHLQANELTAAGLKRIDLI